MPARPRRQQPEGDWPRLGAAIKALRERRNLSQSELADQIGMSASALSRIESRGNLTVSTLRKIGRVLCVEPWEIVRTVE